MNIIKKTLLASAVSAAAILTASAASAQVNYTVTNVGFNGETVDITGGPKPENGVLAGLITLTTQAGIVPTFCVDLFHTINLGNNAYTYTQAPLLFDSNGPIPGLSGNPLSTPQIGEIGRLADIGVQLYKSSTGTQDEYTALQGAIWQIEYGATVTGNANVNSLIASYSAQAEADPLFNNVWSVIPGVNGQNPYLGVTYPGQALVTAPAPNMGEGLLGFAAMTALLIGVRYRGLFV